jgi:hypothetical protein
MGEKHNKPRDSILKTISSVSESEKSKIVL